MAKEDVNMGFVFRELDLKGAYIISNFYAGDNMGSFTKCFEKDDFKHAGIEFQLNETFASESMKNVIRGLHFQFKNPQAKIVSVIKGKVWDVIVDLRADSPTFKQWRGYELSEYNHSGLYIPKGFAHGFACLEDGTVMLYQCDGKYHPQTDTGIRSDDPQLDIKWPVDVEKAIYSQRDLKLMSWDQYKKYVVHSNEHIWGY